MKKIFAIIYFIALTASYSANASQCSYQPTRSIQILAVIKKDGSKSANKTIGKNNVINPQEAVNHSSQIQQIEEPETAIEDVKKEEKISSSSEKLANETNSTDNKINSEQQVQEVAPAQEQGVAEMNPANGVDLDERSEEEKKYKTDSVSEMKTQGHYVGFDVIGMRGRFNEESSRIISGKQTDISKSASTDNGGGVGLNYKYAFNFNNVFIAPGIFAEGLAMEINMSEDVYGNGAQYGEVNIRSRHGAFVDVGYDINPYLSPYVMAGYSWARYRDKNAFGTSKIRETAIEKSMIGSGIYGVGLKVNYDKNISFNIEVNTQKFNLKTNTDVPTNTSSKQYVATYFTRLNTLKVGISYKF